MIYRWICPGCNGAYILPRRTKHQYNHWRCYSCNKVFHEPFEVMSMGMDSMFEDPLHEVKRPANWTEIVSNYDGPYKFHADMMMYSETPSGHAKIGQSTKGSSALKKEKRRRATIVAEQDGKFLLVTERGASRYSLPGGGIEHGEFTLEAASRELREETGLWMVQAEHLFDHEGQVTLESKARLSYRERNYATSFGGVAKKTFPFSNLPKRF